MTANLNPQYIAVANNGQVAVTAANTSSEGGGTIATNIFLLMTAGANDSFLEDIWFLPTASTSPTTTQATVARVFLSSKGSGATSSADTFLLAEVVLPSVSADNSGTAVNPIVVPINKRIKSGLFVLVTNHAAPAANSQWVATAFGGDY